MNRRYPLGDQIVVTATFVDPRTNQPTNPSAVVLRIRDPLNVETRPTVTNVALGTYSAIVTPTSSGIWHSRWEGTGAVMAAIENKFEVEPSAFAGAS